MAFYTFVLQVPDGYEQDALIEDVERLDGVAQVVFCGPGMLISEDAEDGEDVRLGDVVGAVQQMPEWGRGRVISVGSTGVTVLYDDGSICTFPPDRLEVLERGSWPW